ncbi:MAG: urease accessory protein UreF [Methylococcales bacterium]|nr:urease accessory protein UreF [Methylococcales bacterium]
MVTDLALLRLLQLVSPSLPIGMYCYSQGLERAVDDGWLSTAVDTRDWLHGLMVNSLTRVDIPILARLYDAWQAQDTLRVAHWSLTLSAYRETAELRAEDQHTGQALARLLVDLGDTAMQPWLRNPETTLATAFSYAAVKAGVSQRDTALGYLWSWLENQVLCAVKLVPLGQVAGQRLLTDLTAHIPDCVDTGLALADDELGGSAFGLALASSRHEMQYSRLFRS